MGGKRFCCYFTLRQGAVTAAVHTVVAASICLLFGTLDLIELENVEEGMPTEDKEVSGGILLSLSFLLYFTFFVLSLGIRAEKVILIIPWLIVSILAMLLEIVVMIDEMIHQKYYASMFIILVIVHIYLWMNTIRYCQEIQEKKKGQRVQKNPQKRSKKKRMPKFNT